VSTASLLRNTVRDQKDWKTVAFKQFHFFDPTGFAPNTNSLGDLSLLEVTMDDVQEHFLERNRVGRAQNSIKILDSIAGGCLRKLGHGDSRVKNLVI
jgi:hypothetical protein